MEFDFFSTMQNNTGGFVLIFFKLIYFILGAIIPYNFSIIKDETNESEIHYLKGSSTGFKFQFSHDIYTGLCFREIKKLFLNYPHYPFLSEALCLPSTLEPPYNDSICSQHFDDNLNITHLEQ